MHCIMSSVDHVGRITQNDKYFGGVNMFVRIVFKMKYNDQSN